jgi:glutamate 5-kinase
VQYDHGEVRRLAGHASHEVAAILGYAGADTVMHRDDLVLL